jgi:hypothetical protein
VPPQDLKAKDIAVSAMVLVGYLCPARSTMVPLSHPYTRAKRTVVSCADTSSVVPAEWSAPLADGAFSLVGI